MARLRRALATGSGLLLQVLHDGEHELAAALASERGDDIAFAAPAKILEETPRGLVAFGGGYPVDLVQHQPARLAVECLVVLPKFPHDRPCLVRGIDAMQFATDDGPLYALIAADGAIPYRTGLTTTARYDAESVARALEEDLERNGPPLVLRLDRAKAHDAPAVRAVLKAHGVLALHGPPRYPRFYGQLERQNREHRQWMAPFPRQRRALLEPCLNEMLYSVNTLWRRRTLGWKTAAEVWNARPTLTVDRNAFREEVHERARAIAHRLKCPAQPGDLAERLAIERTLEHMGYLRQQIGGWC